MKDILGKRKYRRKGKNLTLFLKPGITYFSSMTDGRRKIFWDLFRPINARRHLFESMVRYRKPPKSKLRGPILCLSKNQHNKIPEREESDKSIIRQKWGKSASGKLFWRIIWTLVHFSKGFPIIYLITESKYCTIKKA